MDIRPRGDNVSVNQRNPYSPPVAVVADQDVAPGQDKVILNGRARPFHHGWKWIAGGWDLFKRQPGMWILTTILYFATTILLSMIPVAGLLTSIMWPIFAAGFFAMSHMAYRHERFNVSNLFNGFTESPGTLALIGLAYVGAIIATVSVFAVFGGFKWFTMITGKPDSTMIAQMGAAMLLYALVTIALATAIIFAPALAQLNGVSAIGAMRMSFVGSMKNVLPGTLYAILFSLLMLVSIIPLGLGLLITVPMITTTLYCAYRDIFLESEPA